MQSINLVYQGLFLPFLVFTQHCQYLMHSNFMTAKVQCLLNFCKLDFLVFVNFYLKLHKIIIFLYRNRVCLQLIRKTNISVDSIKSGIDKNCSKSMASVLHLIHVTCVISFSISCPGKEVSLETIIDSVAKICVLLLKNCQFSFCYIFILFSISREFRLKL